MSTFQCGLMALDIAGQSQTASRVAMPVLMTMNLWKVMRSVRPFLPHSFFWHVRNMAGIIPQTQLPAFAADCLDCVC